MTIYKEDIQYKCFKCNLLEKLKLKNLAQFFSCFHALGILIISGYFIMIQRSFFVNIEDVTTFSKILFEKN